MVTYEEARQEASDRVYECWQVWLHCTGYGLLPEEIGDDILIESDFSTEAAASERANLLNWEYSDPEQVYVVRNRLVVDDNECYTHKSAAQIIAEMVAGTWRGY